MIGHRHIRPPCDEYRKFEYEILHSQNQPNKILQQTYERTVNDDNSLNISFHGTVSTDKKDQMHIINH